MLSSSIKIPNNKCTDKKVKECIDKGKVCNPASGRCIKKPNKLDNKLTITELDNKLTITELDNKLTTTELDNKLTTTKKTKHDFIKELKKYKTAKDVIESFNTVDSDNIAKKIDNNKSRKGFIYELLWDICIKFNITNFTNKDTTHGLGNINNKNNTSFIKIEKYIDKYLKEGYISGNTGGYSDITFKTKEEKEYNLNLVSVKYIAEKNIKKYDIQNLCTLIRDRENDNYKSIKTILFVKNKKKFINLCKSANESSNVLIKYISPYGNYENVYDLNDLEKNYRILYKILEDFDFLNDINKFKENYLKIYKKKFKPRFHQELFIEKITSLVKNNNKKILVGAIPRSGKTYIMAGTILNDIINQYDKTKFNNYLIITPAPNETLEQYHKAFEDYYDFKNNNIVSINVKDNKKEDKKIEFIEEPKKHNVFLISKQRLGFKDKEDNDKQDIEIHNDKYIENIKANILKYFGDNKFKIIFFDEAHFGMSTKIAQDIFSELDKKNESYKIYVTATYNKPKQIYNIEYKNIIKWDLEDIRIIKNIKDKNTFYKAYGNLEKKFGREILIKVLKNNEFNIKSNIKNIKNIKNIIQQYKDFPEPFFITSIWDKDFVDNEIKKIEANETFGFNMHKLFMSKNNSNKFENEEQLIQFLEYYFGYYITDEDEKSKRKKNNENKFYENKNEYIKRGILPNIENICLNHCRTLQSEHKTTQLWFLPPYEINKITKSLIILLKEKFRYIFNNYMFYVAVNGIHKNQYDNVRYLKKPEKIKEEIENLEKELYTNAQYSKYEGLIILAGNRLQLGISLKNVDIVALFTNISASDAIYQMIFRSMTEIEDDTECDGKSYCSRKKYGFMVDLNPQRTLFTIDYLTDIYLDDDKFKDKNKEKKYELIADLINIDKHKFINKYNREDKKGYENYVKEFFSKLYKAWDAEIENLQNILFASNIFDEDDSEFDEQIIHLLNIGNDNMEKDNKKQKNAVFKPENEIPEGKNRKKGKNDDEIDDEIDDENTKKKDEKSKKSPKEMKTQLFAEIISILSLITSYTDKDGNTCIFNIQKKDSFLYELKEIIENVVDKDANIKEIFLYSLLNRLNLKYSNNEEEELYTMIKNKINSMQEKKTGGNLLELNKQIHLRKSKIYSIKEPEELLKFINENLKPTEHAKKERGEVFTPMSFVNEMLNTLPNSVWKNPNLKWLDPAAGMGNFPVAIYMRLMEGLKDVIKDEEKRRIHILKNMLYMVELNKTNVFMMKKIFCGKFNNKGYELNIFEGSFIDFKHFKKINIESKFDIILGNPPFQYQAGTNQAQPIWHYFIKRSYEELLNVKGYLLFVHPSGWRDIDGIQRFIYNYIKENNLIYLSMTSYNNQKIFNASTNFDYYLVQNIKTNNNITIISDIDNINNDKKKEFKIDLNNWNFIPSGNFNEFEKILSKSKNNNVKILHNRSMYGTDKKNTSKIKNNIFKYPIIYTIKKDGTINFYYSNNIDGHFGIPKVIFSNGAGDPIIDKNGDYGMTEFSSAIIDNKDNLKKIYKAMISERFSNLMKYVVFKETHRYNYKIIELFKKDFYKYFLPKKGCKSLSLPKSLSLSKKYKANKSI